jgi:phage-related protein
MNWTIEYYRDSKGKEPVKQFIDALPGKAQAQVIGKIELLAKYGVLLKEPYTRHIKGKIWELRTIVTKGYSRIFYFSYTGRRFVLLHAFLKKTDKTPPAEIDIAEKRMQDFINRQ